MNFGIRLVRAVNQLGITMYLALAGCDPSDFDSPQARTNEDASLEWPSVGSPSDGALPGADGLTDPGDAAVDDTPSQLDSSATGAAPVGSEDAGANATEDARAPEVDGATISEPPPTSGPSPMCTDTVTDPMNCGRCGNSCAAAAANVSCSNGMCLRTCVSGFEDCNKDLILGAAGDGCEVPVANDIKNCGGCGRRCETPAFGFAVCSEQACNGHTLRVEGLEVSELHGNPSGGADYSMLCNEEGEVVTAVHGVGFNGSICSLAVTCSRLSMSRTGTKTLVATGAKRRILGPYGGACLEGGAAEPYALTCPENQVVTAIAGSTWLFGDTANSEVVRRIAITCSSVGVSATGKVSLTPGASLAYGNDVASPTDVFAEPCGMGQSVTGFSGRYGSFFDAIAVHCGAVRTSERPVKAVEVAADGISPAAQTE